MQLVDERPARSRRQVRKRALHLDHVVLLKYLPQLLKEVLDLLGCGRHPLRRQRAC
jgi:hypothetical protein